MRKFFRTASRIIPSNLLIKGIKGSVVSPFYHLVSDAPPLHVKSLYRVLSVKEFENDLDFLLKHFKPIDANALINYLESDVKSDKPHLFLSFDDGFKEVHEIIAPILLKKGIPATFFVNPAYIDNADLMFRCKIGLIVDKLESLSYSKTTYSAIAQLLEVPSNLGSIKTKLLALTYDHKVLIENIAEKINLNFNEYLRSVKPYLTLSQLQELSKLGFTIGGHSYNHPYFNEISFDEQLNEVEASMKWINDRFPNQPRLFAFPFTDYGVSDELISRMVLQPNNLCDISFGTSGLQPIRFNRHLQRIPMEERNILGRNIVRGEILYYLTKKRLGYYKRIHD
jgi:peptidoglycan/xylan/chitin deacetylase (PgdA/CDA1 family)